jgi:hypothetical protein
MPCQGISYIFEFFVLEGPGFDELFCSGEVKSPMGSIMILISCVYRLSLHDVNCTNSRGFMSTTSCLGVVCVILASSVGGNNTT